MSVLDKVLFDRGDYELQEFLRRVLEQRAQQKLLKKLFYPYLHPHGIKELAAPREIRIAYAMIKLLGSLEAGKVEDRLSAMRSLRAEITSANKSAFRLNTARILLQIMKAIVRSQDDPERQLRLIHDFRIALAGRPRTIRHELRKYHLLEMPEAWNQIAFDDHVHDANTKGRKTSSHLIMDAWIKGIRSLKIIYYNHIEPEAAYELLEAGEIMGIKIRISVEFPVKVGNRYLQLIWAPRGFFNSQDFLRFLQRPAVKEFMAAGAEVSRYQSAYTMAVLDNFNQKHLAEINREFQVNMQPITASELQEFVNTGQPSRVHLAELIYAKLDQLTDNRDIPLPGEIYDRYLSAKAHPDISYPGNFAGGEKIPELLQYTPEQLIQKLSAIHNSYRLTLNLSNLNLEDVLEMLFATSGKITHLEIFNLKDYSEASADYNREIETLRKIINSQNVIRLKYFLLQYLEKLQQSEGEDIAERCRRFKSYIARLSQLLEFYRHSGLRSQIGSDSTGRHWHCYGMGLAAIETLPAGARREIRRPNSGRHIIPYSIAVFFRTVYVPRSGHGKLVDKLLTTIRRIPVLRDIGYHCRHEWVEDETEGEEYSGQRTALVSLGGTSLHNATESAPTSPDSHYLNSSMRNWLKVIIGFIPAFLTFMLTKDDWWVLQYGGAFIWFAITGLRNIIQSVLGGRGLRRSDFLPWSNFVSWGRVADSLLYTGISVPILDYVVKTLLLSRCFNITTATSPVMLYSIMALINGCYISAHNIFRGLPKAAVVGNFFRCIISVPVAVLFNGIIGTLLGMAGIGGIDDILQKWAAVISKTASDSVAGFIEGFADRLNNIQVRQEDYKTKIQQIFETFARIELLFPHQNITLMLKNHPEDFLKAISEASNELKEIVVVNALDMLYIWLWQPRARDAFKAILSSMTPDEREIILLSNNILSCEKELSSMLLLDGLLGRKFAKPLAFYLEQYPGYLKAMRELAEQH